jgi:glutaredoxin 2
MNNEHIKKTIPQLIPEIEQQLGNCQSALDELGQPRVTTAEQSHYMVELASKFETLARDALDGNYHNLPDDPAAKVRKIVQESLDNFKEIMIEDYKILLGDPESNLLTSENERTWRGSILADETLNKIHRVILDNRGTEFPDEVNSNVMKVLWKESTTNWMEVSTALVHKLVKSIGKSIEALFNVATKDSELRSNTKKWLAKFLYSSQDEAMEELNKIFSDESNGFLWTLVPEYSLLVGTLYQEGIEAMVQCLKELAEEEEDEEGPGARNWEEELKLWLSTNKDIDSLLMTYVRLNAYYRVAMARFIDNVGLQVVERHLLGKSSSLRIFNPVYVNKMAEENPDLLKSIAGENEAKATLRAEKIREKTSLKEALFEAQRYEFS